MKTISNTLVIPILSCFMFFSFSSAFAEIDKNKIDDYLINILDLNGLDSINDDNGVMSELMSHELSQEQKDKIDNIIGKIISFLKQNPDDYRKDSLLYIRAELEALKADNNRINDLETIVSGLEVFYIDHSYYPSDIAKIADSMSYVPKDILDGKMKNGGCKFGYIIDTFGLEGIPAQGYSVTSCFESSIDKARFGGFGSSGNGITFYQFNTIPD